MTELTFDSIVGHSTDVLYILKLVSIFQNFKKLPEILLEMENQWYFHHQFVEKGVVAEPSIKHSEHNNEEKNVTRQFL